MKVLIFHGYLLRGTGSNVYNAELAGALAALGHEVHMVCQDREAPDLAPPGAPGSVTIHNPEIGGLLPVFVHDTYEGFEVKTFAELTDAELDRYLAANVSAVAEIVDAVGGVDAALANHLVMGPVILARAGLRYAIKVHGSDLSYTVIPELERFGPYAQEACAGAAGILVGSATSPPACAARSTTRRRTRRSDSARPASTRSCSRRVPQTTGERGCSGWRATCAGSTSRTRAALGIATPPLPGRRSSGSRTETARG